MNSCHPVILGYVNVNLACFSFIFNWCCCQKTCSSFMYFYLWFVLFIIDGTTDLHVVSYPNTMYMYTYKRYETTDNALIERSFKQQNDISILTSLFFQIVHLLFNRILRLLRTRWWGKFPFILLLYVDIYLLWDSLHIVLTLITNIIMNTKPTQSC